MHVERTPAATDVPTSRELIVGIDLGTTNSLVAVCDASGPRLLSGPAGERILPSVLTFGQDGRVTVGAAAKAHAVEQPTATVFSVKRLMGRGYEELAATGELAYLPYRVVQRASDGGDRDVAAVEIEGRLYTPPEVSALILRTLKEWAEAELGQTVRRAVVTVPAYFDDSQRQATRDAGRIARLDVVRIVNEPTAAALAYGIGLRTAGTAQRGDGSTLSLAEACPSSPRDAGQDSQVESSSIIAVYDLGGGTFDISILRVVEGVFEVLSTHGNTCLGGDDLDREIMSLVEREVQEQYGLRINAPATRQALRTFAEQVKIRLSIEPSAAIEIDLGGNRCYKRTIERGEFEAMIAPWVDKTIESCRRALSDARLQASDVDQVVLVGGSTRVPLVRERVQRLFGRVPYTALDPDTVVALGASVQAAILAGVRRDALLLDVVPLSLGIETLGGAMGKLILRNTRIPCQATERFSTFADGQTNVKINVLQGERELVKDCRSLGEFELRGIPPMPAGMPRILVTFLIDENGILNVSAREERSGQEASIQIIPTHGLTADEVERMELESYAHAREDMTAHRLIDLRNQVEFDTHKAEQMLAKAGGRLSRQERASNEQAMAALRALASSTQDADALYKALRDFDRQTVRLAELAITETLRDQDGDPGDSESRT
jgi:molecular chaperone DnaK (HSP70)